MYILNKMAIKIITRLCIALRCNTEGQYLRLQHIACVLLYTCLLVQPYILGLQPLINCMSFFTWSLLSLKSSDIISSVSCRSKFPSIFSCTTKETTSSDIPMNRSDLETSSMEIPDRLLGGCQDTVATGYEMDNTSVVPWCGWSSKQLLDSSSRASASAVAVVAGSVSFFVSLHLGVLGGKIGQDWFCLVLHSSVDLSLHSSMV